MSFGIGCSWEKIVNFGFVGDLAGGVGQVDLRCTLVDFWSYFVAFFILTDSALNPERMGPFCLMGLNMLVTFMLIMA